MASRSSGVMARFTGGPKIEFMSWRFAITRGDSGSLPMSMMETVSLPGGAKTGLPASSQPTFSSLPTIISSAPLAGSTTAPVATMTSARSTVANFMEGPLFVRAESWHTRGTGATRAGRSGAGDGVRVDPVLGELLAEGVAVDAENLSGPHLVAARLA